MLNVIPKGYRVLVEQEENRQVGAIQLPDGIEEPALSRFRIVALGEPKIAFSGERIEIPFKVGDYVMFAGDRAIRCGTPDIFNGRRLALVDVEAIVGVLVGEIEPRSTILKATRKAELIH